MMRPWWVALVIALSCRGASPPAPVPASARALVEVGRDFYETAPAELAWTETELARIAEQVQSATRRDVGHDPVVALRKTIFEVLGFSREVDDTDLRFVLLPSVLRSRRGTCVGLGTLYLAVAELLGLPAEGVMRPGHFFVRFREGREGHPEGRPQGRNVELLHKGEELPDVWYEARFPIPGGSAPEYARPLSLAEVLAVVEYDIGNERRRQGRLAEARRAYERATQHFPDFAEAQASLGATLHLLGDLDAAERHYRAAHLANSNLPGLEGNMDLLQRERVTAE
jgi:tetratricopeptide (TPR) repeat protein